MLNPSAEREVNNNYRLSTEKARQWWASQGFESRKNLVIESDAVINDDELVEDQTVADIADKEYDDLPDVTKQEVDSQIDDEEDVEEIFDIEGEEYLQCSTCDDMFTSNEDYDIHKSVDHGEEPEDFEESEETYQLTMNPELTRESLREANDLLRETKPTQLYSGYDKTGGVQSSVMPYNVPSVATGKYNDNPNEFFYSNKIFRAGNSTERNSALGESKASESYTPDTQLFWDEQGGNGIMSQEEWGEKFYELDLKYVGLAKDNGYDFDENGQLITESKASEGDSEWHSDWNKAVQDLKNGDIQSYEEHARKYGFDAWVTFEKDLQGQDQFQSPIHDIEQAIKNMEWTIDYEKSVESKASESLVYAKIFKMSKDGMFGGEIQLVAEGKNKELTEEESLRIKDQYNMKTESGGYTGYVDESEFGIGESKAGEGTLEEDIITSWNGGGGKNILMDATGIPERFYETKYEDLPTSIQKQLQDYWYLTDQHKASEKGEWDWLDKGADNKSVDYDKVKYEDDGVSDISVPNTEEPRVDGESFLDNVSFGVESVDYVYPTKANETKDKSYITESEPFEEEYEEFEDSDKEKIEETITLRKLTGYSDSSIARELHINYDVSHEEALEKVYSIEVSTNDRVAQTFFSKMYKECTESEKDELRMYSGSD